MAVRAVHWHEGMFLRPHHFQALERYWSQQLNRGDKYDLHYNWGLAAIDLDRDALANYRLVIRSLKARLRDGTTVSVPEDGVLPTLDLKHSLRRKKTRSRFTWRCRCCTWAGPTCPPTARPTTPAIASTPRTWRTRTPASIRSRSRSVC